MANDVVMAEGTPRSYWHASLGSKRSSLATLEYKLESEENVDLLEFMKDLKNVIIGLQSIYEDIRDTSQDALKQVMDGKEPE